jgi:hypothetical protein
MSNTRRNSRPPETLDEAIRIWREHRSSLNGYHKLVTDLRATIARITTENETLKAAQSAETEQQ